MAEPKSHKRKSNDFFSLNAPKRSRVEKTGRVLGAIEVPERDENYGADEASNPNEPVYFECLDFLWMMVNHREKSLGSDEEWPDDLYLNLPLSVIELADLSFLCTFDFTAAQPGQIVWFLIDYTFVSDRTANAVLYESLYGEGNPIRVDSAYAISPKKIPFASKSGEVLPPFAISGPLQLNGLLQRVGGFRSSGVAVYDVGQGACQAVLRDSRCAHPGLYVDLGGGVLGNAKTFPPMFASACFSAQPLIVLSHWDWDHWSSAHRFPLSKDCEWLAPPVQDKPVQKTFAAELRMRGKLSLWGDPPGSTIRLGDVELGRCHGQTSNDSGIAAVVSMSEGLDIMHCLLPGDADYRYLPNNYAVRPTWGLVISHHGGRLKSSVLPSADNGAVSVCSVGYGNTYRHPFIATLAAHEEVGWSPAKLTGDSTARPLHVLLTPKLGAVPSQGGCHAMTTTPCSSSFSF